VGSGATAGIHIGLWLYQPAIRKLGQQAIPALLQGEGDTEPGCKGVHHHKSNIVPGIAVVYSRIAKSDNESRAGVLDQLSCAIRPRRSVHGSRVGGRQDYFLAGAAAAAGAAPGAGASATFGSATRATMTSPSR